MRDAIDQPRLCTWHSEEPKNDDDDAEDDDVFAFFKGADPLHLVAAAAGLGLCIGCIPCCIVVMYCRMKRKGEDRERRLSGSVDKGRPEKDGRNAVVTHLKVPNRKSNVADSSVEFSQTMSNHGAGTTTCTCICIPSLCR